MHRLVLESLPVRVLDVQVPVGGTSLSHLHTDPDREFELRNSGPQPVTLVVIEVR